MVWLPDGGKRLMMYLAVSTQYRGVMDGYLAMAYSTLMQSITR